MENVIWRVEETKNNDVFHQKIILQFITDHRSENLPYLCGKRVRGACDWFQCNFLCNRSRVCFLPSSVFFHGFFSS